MTQSEHLRLIRSRCVELLGIWDNKRGHNLTYNATCGKEAEAGWRVTIETIDLIFELPSFFDSINGELADSIISAWPIELLNNK